MRIERVTTEAEKADPMEGLTIWYARNNYAWEQVRNEVREGNARGKLVSAVVIIPNKGERASVN